MTNGISSSVSMKQAHGAKQKALLLGDDEGKSSFSRWTEDPKCASAPKACHRLNLMASSFKNIIADSSNECHLILLFRPYSEIPALDAFNSLELKGGWKGKILRFIACILGHWLLDIHRRHSLPPFKTSQPKETPIAC